MNRDLISNCLTAHGLLKIQGIDVSHEACFVDDNNFLVVGGKSEDLEDFCWDWIRTIQTGNGKYRIVSEPDCTITLIGTETLATSEGLTECTWYVVENDNIDECCFAICLCAYLSKSSDLAIIYEVSDIPEYLLASFAIDNWPDLVSDLDKKLESANFSTGVLLQVLKEVGSN